MIKQENNPDGSDRSDLPYQCCSKQCHRLFSFGWIYKERFECAAL